MATRRTDEQARAALLDQLDHITSEGRNKHVASADYRRGYIAASWAEAIRRDHEVPARLLAQVIQTAKLSGGGVLDMDPIQSAVATYILASTGQIVRRPSPERRHRCSASRWRVQVYFRVEKSGLLEVTGGGPHLLAIEVAYQDVLGAGQV